MLTPLKRPGSRSSGAEKTDAEKGGLIGRCLTLPAAALFGPAVAELNAVEQPVSERLAAVLRELQRRTTTNPIVATSPMDGSHSLLFRSDSSLALRCPKGAIHPITRSPRRRGRAA